MSELLVQYMHRVELPCDEQDTSIFKVKTCWSAFGSDIAAVFGLDEDDPEEQCKEPCDVYSLIAHGGLFEHEPSDKEEHYRFMVLDHLFFKVEDHISDKPSGDWYFKCSYRDPDQVETKTRILNWSS